MPEQKPLVSKMPEQEKKKPLNWKYIALAGGVGIVALDLLQDGELDFFDYFDDDYNKDGIPNDVKIKYGLDPRKDDTDGDGVKDVDEGFFVTVTNPQTGIKERIWEPHYTILEDGSVVIDALLKDVQTIDGGDYFTYPPGYGRGIYIKPNQEVIIEQPTIEDEGGTETP